MKPRYILFEGLDRVILQYCSQRFAEESGSEFLVSPPEDVGGNRVDFDKYSADQSCALYSAGNDLNEIEIGALLSVGKSVVLRRHYPATIAFHEPLLRRDLSYLMGNMRQRPDMVFYFSGDVSRLEQEARESGQVAEKFCEEGLWQKVQEVYRKTLQMLPNVFNIIQKNPDKEKTYNVVKAITERS